MNIIYSDQQAPPTIPYEFLDKSIFLAGPTPRDSMTVSWRPRALQILEKNNFSGTVFVPESSTGIYKNSYIDQVEWEDTCIRASQVIVFWIPRNLNTMPGFTTNIKFGRFANRAQTLYGRPNNSEKNKYLDWYYNKYNGNVIYNNLHELLQEAIKRTS